MYQWQCISCSVHFRIFRFILAEDRHVTLNLFGNAPATRDITPMKPIFFYTDHGFRLNEHLIKGLEAVFQNVCLKWPRE